MNTELKSIKDLVILWNPIKEGLPEIVVIPLKEWINDLTIPYVSSWGGCNAEIMNEESKEKIAKLLKKRASYLVYKCRIPKQVVHTAFKGIAELKQNSLVNTQIANHPPTMAKNNTLFNETGITNLTLHGGGLNHE
jgi:hypothetical protein